MIRKIYWRIGFSESGGIHVVNITNRRWGRIAGSSRVISILGAIHSIMINCLTNSGCLRLSKHYFMMLFLYIFNYFLSNHKKFYLFAYLFIIFFLPFYLFINFSLNFLSYFLSSYMHFIYFIVFSSIYITPLVQSTI